MTRCHNKWRGRRWRRGGVPGMGMVRILTETVYHCAALAPLPVRNDPDAPQKQTGNQTTAGKSGRKVYSFGEWSSHTGRKKGRAGLRAFPAFKKARDGHAPCGLFPRGVDIVTRCHNKWRGRRCQQGRRAGDGLGHFFAPRPAKGDSERRRGPWSRPAALPTPAPGASPVAFPQAAPGPRAAPSRGASRAGKCARGFQKTG